MFDVITFGSAARDIFLRSKQFLIGNFDLTGPQKEILLPYGLKVDVEDIHFHSGGGGVNTATTFSSRGLKVAYSGTIGSDIGGKEILKELRKKHIDTRFVLKTSKKPTNLSVIFSTPQERTILVYKGASQVLKSSQIHWAKIKETEWFYIASLGKNADKFFEDLLVFARKNKIKVMVNPGLPQLKLPLKRLRPLLKKIDILLLNQEEGQILIRDSSLKREELVRSIKKIFPGILIITNGTRKLFVVDNKCLYSAFPLIQKEAVDKTGAGDAFGSGFLAGYIKHKGNIKQAIQLAVANAASCLTKWGAEEGILKKNEKFKRVKVAIHEKS